MDFEKWKAAAIESIQNKALSQVFYLKDLYDEREWNNLSKGDRIKLGKFFKNEVLEGNVPNVMYVEGKSKNATQYIKTEE